MIRLRGRHSVLRVLTGVHHFRFSGLSTRSTSAGWPLHPFDAAATSGCLATTDRVPDRQRGECGRPGVPSLKLGSGRRARVRRVAGSRKPTTITLGRPVENINAELGDLDARVIEHTVTAMPFSGPAVLSRRRGADGHHRLEVLPPTTSSGSLPQRRAGRPAERSGCGSAPGKGRLPVAPLVQQAIGWVQDLLEAAVPDALATPRPPEGWKGAAEWCQQRDVLATTVVKPALARWADVLRELLPRARSAEEPGLVCIPGGEGDYRNLVRSATTLALAPEEIHRVGLEEVEALERRALELGAVLGLHSLEEIHERSRASSVTRRPADAMEAATAAIRRAEARAAEYFPPPLPPPCEVTPMPAVVASSGAGPHYTPPRLDGSRPGTYWFNVDRATVGTGWDLEVVAFHEGVPGHHLQLSRVQMLNDLPDMQRQRALSVFAEGWGLDAEQLAEEMDLYSDTESVLGSVTASLMRAARLVVDTGLHALGWSRQRALRYMVAHVPAPESVLANEIDRYIVFPGQALSYLIGKREARATAR